jgi:hypothetical protein
MNSESHAQPAATASGPPNNPLPSLLAATRGSIKKRSHVRDPIVSDRKKRKKRKKSTDLPPKRRKKTTVLPSEETLAKRRAALEKRRKTIAAKLAAKPILDKEHVRIVYIDRTRMMHCTSGRVVALNSVEHQCAVANHHKYYIAPVYLDPAKIQP